MRPVEIARKLCKGAHPAYLAALDLGDDEISTAGITTSLRLAHFLAQVFHETGGLTVLVEDHRYSAKNLGDAWDSGTWRKYFPNRAGMVAMAGKGEQLFNIVYGNRMGNGGPETGDGFRYRGRGFLQTTGKAAYARYGKRCGIDFAHQPDLILSPEHALKPALFEWGDMGCNALADRNAIKAVGNAINRGNPAAANPPIGHGDRVAWFNRIWKLIGNEPSWRAAAPDPDIAKLQEALATAGAHVEIDGRKGPETEAAIVEVQKASGLPTTGVADAATREAIEGGAADAIRPPLPDTADPPIVAPQSATRGGAVATGLGTAGQVMVEQAGSIQAVADYSPILKTVFAVVLTVGVLLVLYGTLRPLLKPTRGTPA